MQANVIYLIPALGIFSLIVMAFRSAWVSKQDAGDEKMLGLSMLIANGAMAFLKAEWKILSYFAVISAILLGWSGTLVETSHWTIAISFLIGAVLSALAGYIGMKVAHQGQRSHNTSCTH
jgi:K(+)-stimulated pyrophosphate-energized sodium pump